MTKQQIKQMMYESKAIEWFDSENMDWLEYVNVFDRFASLVVAAERVAIEEAEKPRQWQGLTDEEIYDCLQERNREKPSKLVRMIAKAIEEKLKEKNG
jgi:hypothetical protein